METLHRIGESALVEDVRDGVRYGVVFEDNGETGYLYGLDLDRADMPIVDALHVYNVDAAGPDHVVTLRTAWSADGTGVALFVDGVPQAAFDFARSEARCKSGFPPADGDFTSTHDWDHAILRAIEP